MFKIKSATRLAILVGLISASLVWLAMGMSLIPDPREAEIEKRIDVTKAIAVTVSAYTENGRFLELRRVLEKNVGIDPNLVSIAVRRQSTRNHVIVVGPHREQWKSPLPGEKVDSNQVAIDILANGKKWGQLEMIFASRAVSWFTFPLGLVTFLACGTTLATWMVLSKSFKYLNPARVVPNRVRSALDSLAGGLVLITNDGEIAHANRAFSRIVNAHPESILGRRLDEFQWSLCEEGKLDFPWIRCRTLVEAVSGEIVEAVVPGKAKQKFMVNATPILGDKQSLKGILVSFEDVTALERKKSELAKIIRTVRLSRDEVERQNEKLNFLASYDPLTKCMNRRAFFGQFERIWASTEDDLLSVIILDIDHFKSINDNHGHSAGDDVLSGIGEILRETIGNRGLVCRYGGEEFVMLFEGMNADDCTELAETIRRNIGANPIAGLTVTASIGVSNTGFGPMDPQHMLDQADQCLYAAKRNGRNQVVRYDQYGDYVSDAPEDPAPEPNEADVPGDIEHSSVTGLLSALAFRSQSTAEHSVRVADLAVALGENLMSSRELYKLEVAALLHDIGKIGVPDSILNKPGKLSSEEWEVMRKHDDMGVAIVRSAFTSDDVAQIIERHHQLDDSENTDRSISSKILAVCDAFDSLVTEQVYRKAMSVDDALVEIENNQSTQFDPIVVNQLKDFVKSGCFEARRQLAQARALEVGAQRNKGELYESIAVHGPADSVEPDDVLHQMIAKESPAPDHEELVTLIELADEAMDLCRSTQSSVESEPENPTKPVADSKQPYTP